MVYAAQGAVLLVAVLHLYIMLLEMLWWDTPRGRRAFRLEATFAASTRVLAANQGLYNGFLAAGLLWGLWLAGQGEPYRGVETFFLLCVAVAGVFGAVTAARKILFIQTVPAALALALVWLSA